MFQIEEKAFTLLEIWGGQGPPGPPGSVGPGFGI